MGCLFAILILVLYGAGGYAILYVAVKILKEIRADDDERFPIMLFWPLFVFGYAFYKVATRLDEAITKSLK